MYARSSVHPNIWKLWLRMCVRVHQLVIAVKNLIFDTPVYVEFCESISVVILYKIRLGHDDVDFSKKKKSSFRMQLIYILVGTLNRKIDVFGVQKIQTWRYRSQCTHYSGTQAAFIHILRLIETPYDFFVSALHSIGMNDV